MKVQVVLFVTFLSIVSASWLSDVVNGLDEAAKEIDLKTKVKKYQEEGKEIAEEVLKVMPKADWVKETKDYLHGIKLKDVLSQKTDLTMEELVERWNLLLRDLNNEEKFKTPTEMYLKIRQDMKNILPLVLYKKWKSKVHEIAEKIQKVVKDMSNLKMHIKNWEMPSFMKKENLEEEKMILKEAVDAANKKIAEHKGKIMPFVEPKKPHKKIITWINKKFTKPHQESGQSKWKNLLEKLEKHQDSGKSNWKKLLEQIPFKMMGDKNLKQVPLTMTELKEILRKQKDKVLIIKEPSKTEVSVLDHGTAVPILLSEDETKKLKSMSPKEELEYERAEKNWEKAVLKEAERLVKTMKFGKIGGGKSPASEPTVKPTTTMKPEASKKHTMTGNEKLSVVNGKVVPWYELDGEDDDDDDDVIEQGTRVKFDKDQFSKKLADRAIEWFDLKKKIMKKIKSFKK